MEVESGSIKYPHRYLDMFEQNPNCFISPHSSKSPRLTVPDKLFAFFSLANIFISNL